MSDPTIESLCAQIDQIHARATALVDGLVKQRDEARYECAMLRGDCHTLRAALLKIAAFDPGAFRPLADECAIYAIAREAIAQARS